MDFVSVDPCGVAGIRTLLRYILDQGYRRELDCLGKDLYVITKEVGGWRILYPSRLDADIRHVKHRQGLWNGTHSSEHVYKTGIILFVFVFWKSCSTPYLTVLGWCFEFSLSLQTVQKEVATEGHKKHIYKNKPLMVLSLLLSLQSVSIWTEKEFFVFTGDTVAGTVSVLR